MCGCVLRDLEWRTLRSTWSNGPQSSAPTSTSAAAVSCGLASPPSTHTHTPQPPHSLTFIYCYPPRLLSTPTPMPSSAAEPHNYFLWETYCLRVSLSLITIEQKGALTGGTRRAALMLSAPGPPLFSFSFQANGRIRTYQTHCDHTASHSLWR